jgi:ankyrin repeat protein
MKKLFRHLLAIILISNISITANFCGTIQDSMLELFWFFGFAGDDSKLLEQNNSKYLLKNILDRIKINNFNTDECLCSAASTCGCSYTTSNFKIKVDEIANQIVQALIKQKANPNIMDYKNTTPIIYATIHGYKKVIQTLLDAGANPLLVKNIANKTAINYAEDMIDKCKQEQNTDLLKHYQEILALLKNQQK